MRIGRKKQKTPDAWERLRSLEPSLDRETVRAALRTNLCRYEPNGSEESILFATDARFGLYREGALDWEADAEKITEFRLQKGVGCVSVEVVPKAGEPLLLARADATVSVVAADFVKQANRILREKNEGRSAPQKEASRPPRVGRKRAILELIRMARPEWKYLAVSVVFFFLTTGLGILIPYINRILVDDYIQGETENVFWLGFVGVVASILVANLLQRLISMLRGFFLAVAGNHLIVRLRDTVFRKIQTLSIGKITRRTSGELMKQVSGDTNHIKQFIVNQLPSLLEQSMLLVAVVAVLLIVDWRIALLVLVPAPLIMLAFLMFWRWMRRLSQRIRGLNAKENAILHDIFSGIRVVKAYGMEQREEERYVAAAENERLAQLRQEKIWAVLMPLLNLLMGLGEYVILFFLGSQILRGEGMTVGGLSQFSAYAGMIYSPLSTLLRAPRMFVHMLTSVSAIFELLDEPTDVADRQDAKSKGALRGEIRLDRVTFGYDSAEEVLRDVSLEIQPGEFVGIVGRSGVGKSTLINLIMRMYDVDEGAIRIDGTDIREIPQSELRSQMGVVLQETFLFAGTVWQNLTYAKPDATRDEVIAAAKAAGAHEFIIHLPDGYQTVLGERGHTLSGGERQRVAIARALLHDPRILILDEATSALDTETEKQIQDALQVLTKGRTTIAIAHRLSTLRNATKLVVLDRGRVAEVGSHDALMEQKGIYYGLVMAQREMSKMPSADETEGKA